MPTLSDIKFEYSYQWLVRVYKNKVSLGKTNRVIVTNEICNFVGENFVLELPGNLEIKNLYQDSIAVSFTIIYKDDMYDFDFYEVKAKTLILDVFKICS